MTMRYFEARSYLTPGANGVFVNEVQSRLSFIIIIYHSFIILPLVTYPYIAWVRP